MSKFDWRELVSSNLFALSQKELHLYNGDFIATWNASTEELEAVLKTAEILRIFHRNGISSRIFESGLSIGIFRDHSTRTRFAFASASSMLGLTVQELDEEKTQVAHGETVRETANMISFFTEVIGIRDDLFLGEGEKYMLEVATALDDGFQSDVLPQRPAVINLQSDLDHPTQSLSDLMHLSRYYGSLEELKGKKIAVTWAYSPSYGKPLSVPQGLIGLMTRFGMDVVLAHPPGYDLHPEIVSKAEKFADSSGGKFKVVSSMEEAFEGADIVYPKSWAPYKVMQKRTELLKAGDKKALAELEKEALEENSKYKNWECDHQKMSLTAGGKALYMHCLPADISGVNCESGEVSRDVFEEYRFQTYVEASYKPYIIAALILLCRTEKPDEVLQNVMNREENRKL